MRRIILFTILLLMAFCTFLSAEETNKTTLKLTYEKSYGSGSEGFTNGLLGQAQFNKPQSMIFLDKDTLLVADTFNHCVRQISSISDNENATVTTLIGQCKRKAYDEDNTCVDSSPDFAISSTEIRLYNPMDIAVQNGLIYVLDSGFNRVLVFKDGILHDNIFSQRCNASDQDCRITKGDCLLDSPTAIFVTTNNTILVADTGHNRIISSTENYTVSLIAGNGQQGYSATETNAQESPLNTPTGILPYYSNETLAALYIVDSGSGLIRQIRQGDSINWVISNIAGSDNLSTKTLETTIAQLFDLKKPYRMTAGSIYGDQPFFISQPTEKRILGLTPERRIYIAYEGDNLEVPYAMAINKDTGTLWLFDSSGKLKSFKIEYSEK